MILIISLCKEKLSEQEFVRPVENIVGQNFITLHYSKITKKDIEVAEKIIICGTSLFDNEFSKYLDKFSWIKTANKPILGICGGMQVIGLVFGANLGSEKEIGFYNENFIKDFLGLKGKQEVYHLHNHHVELPDEFEKYTESKIVQAFKHKSKPIYGTLFHPEVRNKEVIETFLE